MWIFLGLLMVLTVSGDPKNDNSSIHGIINENVLLPCNCSNINMSNLFTWQKKEEPISSLKITDDKYRGRVKLFLNESKENCSLLLLNITADDQGTFQCNYHKVPSLYTHVSVDLKIFERLRTHSEGKRLFKCQVHTRDPHAEILWRSNGTFLYSSFETNISTTKSTKSPGIYFINSTLTTRTNVTPDPECVPQDSVDIKGLETDRQPQQDKRLIYIVTAIVFALGLSLFALLSWNVRRRKRGYRRTGSVENVSCNRELVSPGGSPGT